MMLWWRGKCVLYRETGSRESEKRELNTVCYSEDMMKQSPVALLKLMASLSLIVLSAEEDRHFTEKVWEHTYDLS